MAEHIEHEMGVAQLRFRSRIGILAGVSVAAAILIYVISEYTFRREAPTPTPTPAG